MQDNKNIQVKEMRNFKFKMVLSSVSLLSVLTLSLPALAAPVKLEQVRQIINAKPGKASTAAFSQLRLTSDDIVSDGDDKDDKNKVKAPAPPQDDRVITTTTSEIVMDEVCDCTNIEFVEKGGFPKLALLGLGAVPLLFLIPKGSKTPDVPTTPTVTPTVPTTETPTVTPTPPTTPTVTPPTTPTPPEPVPEPMTILLFGTGLASIGMAARKKLGKKDKE